MTVPAFEREILSDAVDDWFALWEVLAIARNLFASMSETDQFEFSKATLKRMVTEGLVFLCFFKHSNNDEVRIPADKTDYVLDDDANWQPEFPNKWHIRFAATEKGEKVYYDLPPWK